MTKLSANEKSYIGLRTPASSKHIAKLPGKAQFRSIRPSAATRRESMRAPDPARMRKIKRTGRRQQKAIFRKRSTDVLGTDKRTARNQTRQTRPQGARSK